MSNRHIQIHAANPKSWQRPSDWIDISSVNDNEINLLVATGQGIAFIVTTASGTYSVDWGDGVIETGLASGVVKKHSHVLNGTPCSLGYDTWMVRIYGASSNITGYACSRFSTSIRPEAQPVLDIVFGTKYLTSLSVGNADGSANGMSSRNLRSCTLPQFLSSISLESLFRDAWNLMEVNFPDSLGEATNCAYMFHTCKSLAYIKLPSAFGKVTTTQQMFYQCYALTDIIMHESWGSVTHAGNMFYSCMALEKIVLPSVWGSTIQSVSSMFIYCYNLKSVGLPSSWGASMTDASSMFSSCNSLEKITIPSSWNNLTAINSMFINTAIKRITLPASWGSIANIDYLFAGCVSLINAVFPSSMGNITSAKNVFIYHNDISSITNLGFIGSSSAACDFTNFITECIGLQETSYSTNSLIKRIDLLSWSTNPLKLTSIRLTNPASTFTGSSPHVDVSYTSLNAAALNLLFGDLPTLTGKTIKITGCPGAASCTRSIATVKGWSVTG